VEQAVESGITFFDTADCYGQGRAEAILGRVLKRAGAEAVVATKCGLIRTPATAWNALRSAPRRTVTGLLRQRRGHREYSPGYVHRAAEASLRRLGRDRLDILLLHSPSRPVIDDAAFVETLEGLKSEGRIRAWGISVRGDGEGADDALRALELPGIGCVEIEVNVCNAASIDRVLRTAVERGAGVIARQPFASGALLERAAERQSETAAACLQFVLGLDGVSVVIPGMTRPEHVRANAGAAANRLPVETVEEIRRALC
jgi:aryl-alcohol dehydrogenase-like predicted oxidoreductase